MSNALKLNVPKYSHSSFFLLGGYVLSHIKGWFDATKIISGPLVLISIHSFHLINTLYDRSDFNEKCRNLSKFVSSEVQQGDHLLIKCEEKFSYGIPLTEIVSISGIIYNAMKYLTEDNKSAVNSWINSVVLKISRYLNLETETSFNYVDKIQYAMLGTMVTTGLLSVFFGGSTASMEINYDQVTYKPQMEDTQPIIVEVNNYISSQTEEFDNDSKYSGTYQPENESVDLY